MHRMLLILISLGLLTACGHTQESTASPYAGQQQRPIKALSRQQTDDYLAGKGMGLAKAAELNHYPGPRHVLDLRDRLQLTAIQSEQTEALFVQMQQEARTLGRSIVDEEQQLDNMFAGQQVDEQLLQQSIMRIAELNGKLRFVHLRTHLQQKQILTQQQIAAYELMRGYRDHNGQGEHHHQHHQ